MALFLVIIAIAIFVAVIYSNRPVSALSNWHHTFRELKFPTQEFYKKIEEVVNERGTPDISFSRINYSESGIFSARREYLRISRNEYVFDICAAPFGKDFFVSWWLGEKPTGVVDRIPVVNKLIGKDRKSKTYYQVDTEAMFKGAIHSSVLDAIDQITTAKGIRALSESERKPNDAVNIK